MGSEHTGPHPPTHMHTYHARADTNMKPHKRCSGPHKLDVRLLLNRGRHQLDSLYSSGAKQLRSGFSIVLPSSTSAESNPVITCQIQQRSTPGGRTTKPDRDSTLRLVYRRTPLACSAAERARNDTRAKGKNVQMSTRKQIRASYITTIYYTRYNGGFDAEG